METAEYKNLFLSEAREILSALNTALVGLEKHPEDRELLNEIFRHAHTLKGMAGSMGYTEISQLTHQMESTLDLLRQGKLKANKATVDLLFGSLDALEALVNQVDTPEGQEKKKKQDLVSQKAFQAAAKLEKIRKGFSEEKKPVGMERRSNLRLEEADRREIIEGIKAGLVTYRVTVSLKKDCRLKEPRAFMIVKTLQEMGRVLRAEFLSKQLEQGKFGRHFGLFFTTKEGADEVREKIEAIADVAKMILRPLEIDEVMGSGIASPPKNAVITRQRPGQGRSNLEEEPKQEVQMVRVALDKLDHLMNVVGELVINKIQLMGIGKTLENKTLFEALGQMERLTDDLQNDMMQVRLVPMDYIFNRYPRMVRDVASEEKKEVDLVIEGAEIGLDRTILDKINEPLIHLLRNAVSHGIETPEVRKKSGKKPQGTLRLMARRERNFVLVEVADDGQGMDPVEIKKVALQKGLISMEELKALRDEEALMLITSPGFSTSKVVTQTSGRGVGMNSVRKTVDSFGGTLKIESLPKRGSTFTLKLPLSLAIVQALLVQVQSETYAIPLVNVVETVKVRTDSIHEVEHHEVVPYRDTVLPLVRLAERFGFGASGGQNGKIPVVVVETGHRKAGLVADAFLGQQEVVIKMLRGTLKNVKGIAGATILGSGRVAMIVDVASLI